MPLILFCTRILRLAQWTMTNEKPEPTDMDHGGTVDRERLQLHNHCHDHDIPPQPSHTYSCLLAVQTPPEQSLTKPKPIPGLPNPSIAFPNSSAAFLKQ